MFTWECPTCGKELDVGTVECPVCHPESVEKPAPHRRPAPTPPKQTAAASPPREPAAAKPPVATVPPRHETPEPAPTGLALPPRAPRKRRRRAAANGARTGLPPAQIAVVAVVLIIAIGLAVYFARPGWFGRGAAGLQLEGIPEAAAETSSAGTAARGSLQVAGIRTFYDGEYQTRVRAVIINHGDSEIGPVDLEVQLRPTQASLFAAPLASFNIQVDELGPNESREIETELKALGTLASLPPWDEVRIDLRSTSDTGVTADSS